LKNIEIYVLKTGRNYKYLKENPRRRKNRKLSNKIAKEELKITVLPLFAGQF